MEVGKNCKYLGRWIRLPTLEMSISIGLDDIINTASVFDRIWSIIYDHIRSFTRSMDVDISIAEYRLKDSRGIGIYFLDSVEATLGHSPWERRKLFDTDDSGISNNEEIELIIDPIKEDKCQKGNPIYRDTCPIDCLIADNLYNRKLIGNQYPSRNNKGKKIEKMVDEDNPVSMERHYDFFIFFEEGNMFFFDHVIWGSLR